MHDKNCPGAGGLVPRSTDMCSDSAAKQILLHLDSARLGPSKFVMKDGETGSSVRLAARAHDCQWMRRIFW